VSAGADASGAGTSADIARMLSEASAAHSAGDLQRAAAGFEAVIKLAPHHSQALRAYALLALQVGQPHAALSLAQRALADDAASAEAYQLLGVAQRQCGRLAEAIASLEQAVKLNPNLFDARLNLGSALLDTGDAGRALPHYQRALALNPHSASAHNNLGNLYREQRQPAQAMAAYQRALELEPNHAKAHANLANILRDIGDVDAAIAEFRRSLSLSPNNPDVWSNLLLALNESDRVPREAIFLEHVRYGERFARRIPARRRPSMRALKGRRLRIGYVSSDFRKHAVATFFEPLLAAHDRSRFEIFCYYNYPRGDEVTASIRTAVEHFVPIAGVPDRVLAERITGEGIDVLVDLNGHSADNRLPLFFFAAAPVQATWLGYPGTTGVRAIDYRLTDSCADPPGATESLHTETLWRLPTTAWCYEPYAAAPAVTRRDRVRQGIAFTCLNGPGKTSAAALGMWAEILRAVPRSRLQLLASPHAPRMSELLGFFSERGVAPERIELVARQPLASYLALYGNADIALDSYPHTGATTTCDALWMGLPVVTLAGNRPFTRSGASVLTNVGLRDLIAETPADYVRIACALAADHARLARLRAELRATMSGSRLTDGRAFARDMEEAFVAMCQAAAANAPRLES